jgi:hypothetical protein
MYQQTQTTGFKIAVVLIVLSVAVSVIASDKNEVKDPTTTYSMTNDTISVILNDVRFPLDDFDLPVGTTHFWNMYVGFFDGTTGYYFSDSPQTGLTALQLVSPVTVTGVDPNKTISMTFADNNPAALFTIDFSVTMLGDGSNGVHCVATITALAKNRALNNSKFYLYTDLAIAASDPNDVTAFNSEDGIFFAFDELDSPNTWFGCHSESGYPLHYQGLPYSGGAETLRTAILGGNNFTDTVNTNPEDQVAGWNWDLGTVDGVTEVHIAIAANVDYSSLRTSLLDALPNVIFFDGFESGDMSGWSNF